MGDNTNGFNISDNDMDALYTEFVRRFTQEQELKQNGNPLPLEITTELDEVSEPQQDKNFKRFRRESKKYALEKWNIPECITANFTKRSTNIKQTLPMLSQKYTKLPI
ncbi:hypothetical protein BCV72DRAFT_326341 [Rhizopus microsporus var. microsporus]|uniref:Uncharacterized protein n=2 Tax=Rhizopus microsporus TaxID=58291 RepID=A0A2G4SGB5_RHIZD|nr:uncharacterized protein RHIMIDRAFT_95102 [Rhizopus microsporus ATCC 52813]ORE07519.1 hypothetical protein BCV72DRAFT_326341 [Rhizopus microsporus var. microsporus]PHZ07811.1 hypothetical protein RHIMIDRAFT_95102 [Rhizopus microsporus ATCC 52813]